MKLVKQKHEELSRKRTMIERGLERVRVLQKSLDKRQKQLGSLPTQIAGLEDTVDADDDAGILKLATLKTKMEFVERDCVKVETALNGGIVDLRAASTTGYFADLFHDELNRIEEIVIKELVKTFGPHEARVQARQSETVRNCARFLNFNCAGISDPELAAAEALRMISVLLDGTAPGFELLAK